LVSSNSSKKSMPINFASLTSCNDVTHFKNSKSYKSSAIDVCFKFKDFKKGDVVVREGG
jgi:hypothetical protein